MKHCYKCEKCEKTFDDEKICKEHEIFCGQIILGGIVEEIKFRKNSSRDIEIMSIILSHPEKVVGSVINIQSSGDDFLEISIDNDYYGKQK